MTHPDPDLIDEVLRFDPLSQAERVTGKSYKEDPATLAQGVLMHMANNEQKARLLSESGDTYSGAPFEHALRVYAEEGFQPVLSERFARPRPQGEGQEDAYMLLWHDDGLLIAAESYSGFRVVPTVNRAHLHFCHQNLQKVWSRVSCSSSPVGPKAAEGDRGPWTRYCSLDLREGFRHNLAVLRSEGPFVSPWPGTSCFWLHNGAFEAQVAKAAHRERVAAYEQETLRYLALLPQRVQDAVRPGLAT